MGEAEDGDGCSFPLLLQMLKAKVSIPLACIGVAPVIEREAERGAGDTCGYCAVAASGPVSWQSPLSYSLPVKLY